MIGYWCIGVLVYWGSQVSSLKSQVKKDGVARQRLQSSKIQNPKSKIAPNLFTSHFSLLTSKNLPTHAIRPEVG